MGGIDMKKTTQVINSCSRHYIGFLHCPYEYNSCNKCTYYKVRDKEYKNKLKDLN